MVPNRESERARIVKSFDVFDVTDEHRALILEALDSPEWDWFEDCDGCTTVSELHWPTKYFPPCLRHDFDCATGRNGWQASARFYMIQRVYGVPVWRASLRAAGVTAFWYGWGRWQRRASA
jgi:hypothetical protein